jgi:SWI/SNF-related matrix-associated actin-dependent regulator of chromatin subfamily A member 5
VYLEDEDQFLVCMTHELGYGEWDALKDEVRRAWQFRFDWFIKSRSAAELGRRVDVLIRIIEKEGRKPKPARRRRQHRVDQAEAAHHRQQLGRRRLGAAAAQARQKSRHRSGRQHQRRPGRRR